MIDDFIKQTVSFLERTDTRIHAPEIRTVRYEENTTSLLMSDSEVVYLNRANISDNVLLGIMFFFSIIDAKVDLLHPELDGESFRQRYKRMTKKSDDEIILSQLFRILKLLRNASVHSKNSIVIKNNEITCSYSNMKTNFQLIITKLGLELIYSLILELVKTTMSTSLYYSSIRRTYYDDIKANIKVFADDLGDSSLLELSNGIRLKRGVRYKITNSIFKIEKDYLIIEKPYDLPEDEKLYRSCDYEVNYNGKNYLIPSEALDSNNKMDISHLCLWEL
ncbi:hypothetical protein [Schinkia azotoformans]|uniref:hypothetical protein n=1 Tax=Schinkia azotoformans TaxID=1454 RepID=UPI002DB5A5C4|nr:hypothetical protein [Schinkia azotoformans]MEC1720153.1 hypothetical protein [Schinkia azotoformans]MED4411540.1 hypothetical protein [Schinkia azotoformans]